MKEIILRLADNIAEGLAREAKETGVTSEELIKFILGKHVRCTMCSSTHLSELRELIKEMGKLPASFDKEMLKVQARAGTLACKNCTLKLTEQDVENGKCGSCGAPLK